MGSESEETEAEATEELLATLANRQRRRVVLFLREQSAAVETDTLAEALQSTGADGSVLTSLVHCHLPKLVAADLVTWDRDAGLVATTDHPAYGTPGFDRLLTQEADGWDAVLRALADERRRITLATLATRDCGLDRRTLARLVAAREDGAVPPAPDSERVDAVESSLHHVHLPKLTDAGLVAVDGDEVRFEGHPALDDAWVSFDAKPEEADEPAGVVVDADSPVQQLVELVE